jgi:putative PIN family toxin of toxin-antitoxin system
MRLVLDSNVIIAAFATRGICHAMFEYCLENHDVILCEEILGEVRAVLLGKIKVPEDVTSQIESYLRKSAELVRPAVIDIPDLKYRSDLPILGAAVSSGADYLVTGDGELQALRKVADTMIASPRIFWEKMKNG